MRDEGRACEKRAGDLDSLVHLITPGVARKNAAPDEIRKDYKLGS
jgi:hypothetical protein